MRVPPSITPESSDVAFDRSGLGGQPRGLSTLFFTEMWERFSYYGMSGLLGLYLVKELLLPGHVGNIAGFGAFARALVCLCIFL